ncbi:MAG: DUF2877 domain-containing protein [Candidatus Entotheonellia bacterium]
MDAIITANVIAASAGVLPLLQAAPWDGSIAAVFQRSILCTAPDKRLLHLHSGPRLVSPFSLRIQGDFATVRQEGRLVQGMPVRKSDSAIEIAEHVHLRLDAITSYQSPSHMLAGIAPEAVRMAWQVLRTHGRPGGFERLPGIHALVTMIQQALADSDDAQMIEAARGFIGLGPGLTPSGDDFLVGCLRGLWLIRRNERATRQRRKRWRTALLPDLDECTTRVGAEFIRYAIHGAFAEVLDQAALSLLIPSHPQMVPSAVGRLLTQGETSGTDTALGLLRCLETLSSIPDREPRHEWQDAPATFSSMSAATPS